MYVYLCNVYYTLCNRKSFKRITSRYKMSLKINRTFQINYNTAVVRLRCNNQWALHFIITAFFHTYVRLTTKFNDIVIVYSKLLTMPENHLQFFSKILKYITIYHTICKIWSVCHSVIGNNVYFPIQKILTS